MSELAAMAERLRMVKTVLSSTSWRYGPSIAC